MKWDRDELRMLLASSHVTDFLEHIHIFEYVRSGRDEVGVAIILATSIAEATERLCKSIDEITTFEYRGTFEGITTIQDLLYDRHFYIGE